MLRDFGPRPRWLLVLVLALLASLPGSDLRAQESWVGGGIFGSGGGGQEAATPVAEALDTSLGYRYMALEPMIHEWYSSYREAWIDAATQDDQGFSYTDAGRYLRAEEAALKLQGKGSAPLGPDESVDGVPGPAAGVRALIRELTRQVQGEQGAVQVFHRAELARCVRLHDTLVGWMSGKTLRAEVGGTRRQVELLPASFAPIGTPRISPRGTVERSAALDQALAQEVATLLRMARANAQEARASLEVVVGKKTGMNPGLTREAYVMTYGDVFAFEGQVKVAAVHARFTLVQLDATLATLETLRDGLAGAARMDPESAKALDQLRGEHTALAGFVNQHWIHARLGSADLVFRLELAATGAGGAD